MQLTIRTTAVVWAAMSYATAAAQVANEALPRLAQERIDKVELADLVGRLDLSIPQSPTFTLLGLTPDSDYLLAAVASTPEVFPDLSERRGTLPAARDSIQPQSAVPRPATSGSTQQSEAEVLQALAAGARKAIPECLERFKKSYWNGGALELALAGYRSQVEGFDEDGFGAALGYSHSLSSWGQIVLRAQYADNRLVAPSDSSSSYSLIDQSDVGMRLRYGSDQGTFMVEAQWVRARSETMDEEYWRTSVGAEFMVLPDIWVQLAVGKAFSTDMFEDDPVYSGQLRFGFSQKSLLSQR